MIMSMSRVYSWIIITIMLYSLSFSQNVEFHEMIGAISKIEINMENKLCVTNKDCSNGHQCIHSIDKKSFCVNPCPGSCGIEALCYVTNQTVSCECPRCHVGDPTKKCEIRQGLQYWVCMFWGFN